MPVKASQAAERVVLLACPVGAHHGPLLMDHASGHALQVIEMELEHMSMEELRTLGQLLDKSLTTKAPRPQV